MFSDVSGARGGPGKSLAEPGSMFAFSSGQRLDQQLSDLPARKLFRAGNVKQSGAILGRQFPDRPRRFTGENRAAEFVREQFHFLPRLPAPAATAR